MRTGIISHRLFMLVTLGSTIYWPTDIIPTDIQKIKAFAQKSRRLDRVKFCRDEHKGCELFARKRSGIIYYSPTLPRNANDDYHDEKLVLKQTIS